MSGQGDLTTWAQQGVLLLNATLTVEQAKAGSHQNQGWEQFTDAVISRLMRQGKGWCLCCGEAMRKERAGDK